MTSTEIAAETTTQRRVDSPLVLLVDDDHSLFNLLERRLSFIGCRVAHVTSGAEALPACHATGPSVVLLDLMLPDTDGAEVLAELREHYPKMPVLMLTASGSIANASRCLGLGALDFLTKPFEAGRLEISVRNAVRLSELERERVRLTLELQQESEARHALESALDELERASSESGASNPDDQLTPRLESVERDLVRHAITACRGNISEAARMLGVGRTTLYRKMHRLGIFTPAAER